MRPDDESFTGLDTAHRGSRPRGGGGGGGIYHMAVRNGSRAKGSCARAAAAYIQRAAEYGRGEQAAELVYTESGHMPAWADAEAGATAYWHAADLHERANGQLFKGVEVALPLALTPDEQQDLAVGFAHYLTDAEQLPYTLAIHAGNGENPHCHLMISERGNDGVERAAEQWFKRYNAAHPELGGACKSRALQPKSWLLETRAAWAEQTNQALERAGHDVRIDHRSLKDQGIDRVPGVHLGPQVQKMEGREIETDRGNEARAVARANVELAALAAAQAQLAARLADLERRKAADAERAAVQSQPEEVEDERASQREQRESGRAGVERAGKDVGEQARGLEESDLQDAAGRFGAERGEGRAAEPERRPRAGTGAAGLAAGDAESAHPPHGRRGPARGLEREDGGPEREDGGPARAGVPGPEPGSVAGGAGERGGERGGGAGRGDAVSDSRPGGPGERAADPGDRAVERAVGGDDTGGTGGDYRARQAEARQREEAAVELEAELMRAELNEERAARKAERAEAERLLETIRQEEADRQRRQEREQERGRGRDEDFDLEP